MKNFINRAFTAKKKIFSFVCITCAMVMGVFTSCNNQNTPVPPTPAAKVMAEMTYKFSVNEEIQKRFDVIVKYYDADGTVKTETLAQPSFEKKVKTAGLPSKLGIHVTLQVKEGWDINTMEPFYGEYSYDCMGYCVDENGNVVSSAVRPMETIGFRLKEGKVAEWYETTNKDGLISILYEFKADKTIAQLVW